MCCCCGLRVTTICASVFSLVQSLIGIAFSVFIIVNYNNCFKWFQIDNTFYIFYFYKPECFYTGKVMISVEYNFVDRTLTWGIAYLALNSAWLVSSFLMAVCSCVDNPKKTVTYFLYSPWMMATTAIVIADLAAAIVHFADISQLQGLLDQVSDAATWWQIVLGPLAMGLIFSRFIIGWIINLGMLICVSIAIVILWKKSDNPKVSPPRPGAPPLEESDYVAGCGPRQVERAQPGRREVHLEDPGGHFVGSRVQSLISQQPRVIVPDPREAYVNREEEKNQSKAPKGYFPDESSSQLYDKDEPRASYGGTAVRNQLPWSYFQSQADPRRPIPRQPGAGEGLDRPPVPVPDYTLHIGKRPKDSRQRQRRSSREADVLY
ncbi:uncharacterized protein LOC134527117 isoform X2 [Bacillus rossius redtenbacheri]|uniref:uncharacterized protein LOC134527117 isoform X2 n=1 Tax=Bacillus rossius redtenbacheri TaxID=93214 RepID=UPI002FDD263B